MPHPADHVPERGELPRLRVHHLLALAAVGALLLTYYRLTSPQEVLEQAQQNILGAVVLIVGLVLWTVGVTVAIFSIIWHFQGHPALAQPGQWLLVGTLVSALQLFWRLLYQPWLYEPIPWSKNILLWTPTDILQLTIQALAIGGQLVPVLLFAWCAWRIADSLAWRVLFSIIAVGALLSLLPINPLLIAGFNLALEWVFGLQMIGGSILYLVLVVWVMVDDFLRARPRLWTHWLGIGLFAFSPLLNLLGGILYVLGVF